MVSNPRFPHHVTIKRGGTFDQFGNSESVSYTTIYDGVCRNYQKEYVKTTGEVMQSIRCLSIPIKNGEWSVSPKENDEIIVEINGITESGRLVDKQPNNFGTNIYWVYERN